MARSDVVDALAEAVERRGVLLHGTPRSGIDAFAPGRQTDYRGREREAVFATDDPVWALFFATMRREVVRETRNASLCLPHGRRLYYFSIVGSVREASTRGYVYLLPRETFVRESRVYPEWTSRAAVRPVDVVSAEPADFPYADRIVRYRPGEPRTRFYLRLLAGRAVVIRRLAA